MSHEPTQPLVTTEREPRSGDLTKIETAIELRLSVSMINKLMASGDLEYSKAGALVLTTAEQRRRYRELCARRGQEHQAKRLAAATG